ncbi:MAG: bifunctional hydroxymethylpyrimidine kinase/phosphomethylpyrimidine kinase [Acidobacteriota bacterium]|nr:bifunctional hydroxymethylpyrimidine kinase/phosphomethylpyrimidine kinase [Acidobacteriota bacterium]
MPILLTIAGYDPSSGAGVTADLQVMAAHGHFGISCITSLTVQSTLGVEASHPVDPAVVRHTLGCLARDLPPAGIKLGMLATAQQVHAVADWLQALPLAHGRPVVLDPVLYSSSGRQLLSDEGLDVLRQRLLPLVTWTTPNLDEAAVLADLPVGSAGQMLEAAQRLRERYPQLGVVVTGGHLEPPDDLVVTSEGDSHWLVGTRIDSQSTHGTGCAFSTALACRLVSGHSAAEAAAGAKQYVAQAIQRAPGLGHGKGPLELLWPLR